MTKKKRAYLSGPMHGRPDFNMPLFDHVAPRLRGAGYEVFNPAEHARRVIGPPDKILKLPPEKYERIRRGLLGHALHLICTEVDILFLLPDWQKSKGAYAEHEAAVACGIEIQDVPSIMLPYKQKETT